MVGEPGFGVSEFRELFRPFLAGAGKRDEVVFCRLALLHFRGLQAVGVRGARSHPLGPDAELPAFFTGLASCMAQLGELGAMTDTLSTLCFSVRLRLSFVCQIFIVLASPHGGICFRQLGFVVLTDAKPGVSARPALLGVV